MTEQSYTQVFGPIKMTSKTKEHLTHNDKMFQKFVLLWHDGLMKKIGDNNLEKAAKMKTPKGPNFGTWKGMTIIAIGPKGGKIVGYDSKGKPIYAGSNKAELLWLNKEAATTVQGAQTIDKLSLEWLVNLGIEGKVGPGYIKVSDEAGTMLHDAFGISGEKASEPGFTKFKFNEILPHVGEPLKPHPNELMVWAAKAASGQLDSETFPKLENLVEVTAGEYAGTHGNRLFKDKTTGKRWLFKGEDPTIARAEEAASYIGRLIMGDRIPESRYVVLEGKDGVLIQILDGQVWQPSSSQHSNPQSSNLKKYAKQILQHQVVDWLIANHDSHAGNFLSNGKDLNAIDKGQAWKWVGTDKLDGCFSGENPSKPVYCKFWNEVLANDYLSKKEIIDTVAEAVSAANKITPEQFQSMIGPYVGTLTGWKTQIDPEKLTEKMVGRLKSLRKDFEKFLSEKLGQPVSLPVEAEAHFETMPEVEGKPGKPKMTIQEPGKPKVLAVPGMMVEKLPGWPIKKGSGKGWVEVFYPGEPPPTTGKWPKGIPGPGYTADIYYKGQTYTLEILPVLKYGKMAGKTRFQITYPSGESKEFTSSNAAGDSLYLYHNELDLNMTATEKKANKISLGTKVFKFDQFKEEFAAVQGGEKPSINEMAPAELEKEKVVPEKKKELTETEIIAKQPDGIIQDYGVLPQDVKEFLEAHTYQVPKDWAFALVPGVPVKVTTPEGKPAILAAQIDVYGNPTYFIWEDLDGKMVSTFIMPAYADAGYQLMQNTALGQLKAASAVLEPKSKEAQVGEAPKAKLPEEAKVPENAPKQYAGPLPPGTVISTKKKFPWDQGKKKKDWTHVELIEMAGKLQIYYEGPEGEGHVGQFDTLSAASDWVWVNQKGYGSVDEYKSKTGKNKVPSGGGWKFWGIEPEASPVAAEKPPEGKEWGEPLPGDVTPELLGSALIGTELKVGKGINAQYFVKVQVNAWKQVGTETVYTDSHLAKIALAEVIPPMYTGEFKQEFPEKKVPIPAGWKNAELPGDAKNIPVLEADPIGTKYQFTVAAEEETWEKIGENEWKHTPSKAKKSDQYVAGVLAQAKKYAPVIMKQEPLESEDNWDTMPKAQSNIEQALNKAPVGGKVKVVNKATGEKIIFQKLENGNWENVAFPSKGEYKVGYLADILHTATTGNTIEENWTGAKVGAEPNWETMPDNYPKTNAIVQTFPVGMKIKLIGGPQGHSYTVEKKAPDKWEVVQATGPVYNTVFADEGFLNSWKQATKVEAQLPKKKLEAVAVWNDLTPKMQFLHPDQGLPEFFEAAPKGTHVILYLGSTKKFYTKGTNGEWIGEAGEPPKSSKSMAAQTSQSDSMEVGKGPGGVDPYEYDWKWTGSGLEVLDMIPSEEGFYIGAPVGASIMLTKPDGKVVLFKKLGEGSWKNMEAGTTMSDYSVSVPASEAVSMAVQAPPKDTKIVIPAQMHLTPEKLPPKVASAITSIQNYILEEKWNDVPPGGTHAPAEKPGGWAPWAPPTGVVFEAEWEGKKFFAVSAMSGYSDTGSDTENEFKIVIYDQNGNQFDGAVVSGSNAIQSLLGAAQAAGIGISSAAAMKKLFGLKDLQFAPGETLEKLKAGSGPSLLPDAPSSVDELDTPEKKVEKVKVTTTVSEALKNHPLLKTGTLVVKHPKNAPQKTWVCLDGTDNAAAKLNAVATELGFDNEQLTKGKYPKTNAKGALMMIPSWILEQEVVVEMDAIDAVSVDKPVSEDNWETMPEGVPKVIVGGQSKDDIEKILDKMLVGTVIGNEASGFWKKTKAGFDFADSVPELTTKPQEYTSYTATKYLSEPFLSSKIILPVFPPGLAEAAVGVPQELKGAKPKKKTSTAKKKEQAKKAAELEEKKKKAKELAEWSQKYPAVAIGADLHVLAHFQNHFDMYDLKKSGYARVDGEYVLVGHKDDPVAFQKMLDDLKIKYEQVDSPVGPLFKTTTLTIANALPGDPAGQFEGPDGKWYPNGTKFKKKTTKYTVQELLEPKVYKLIDHKADPKLKMIKMTGGGEEQIKEVKKLVAEFNLECPFPEPKSTGSKVIHFVTKESLAKVHKTETETVPEIPKQPDAFVQASLPFISLGQLWQEAGDNRDDLVALDTIKPPIFGHKIRMGQPGTLKEFSVSVRRVKTKEGMVYEISGDLVNFSGGDTKGMKSGYVKFASCAGTKDKTTGWDVLKYNEAEGYHDEASEGGEVASYHGFHAKTKEGSKVEVVEDSSQHTFNGHFRVRVPVGGDVEKELAEAFKMLGYDSESAMSRVDEDSERIYKKMKIVQGGLGAKGWSDHHGFTPSKIHSEQFLDKMLKDMGLADLVDDAQIMTTFQGHTSVVVADEKRFKDAGWKFAYVGTSVEGAFMQILQGAGWAARKGRYVAGTYSSDISQSETGQSAGSDVGCGGAQGTFFRLATKSVAMSASYNVQVIAHPRVFQRTDWWRYNGDGYGTTSDKTPGTIGIHSASKRTDVDHVSSHNEMMFEGGVALEDLVVMLCDNDHYANTLKEMLKKNGITEINGKTLDEFIQVRTTTSGTQLAEKFLKEK